MLGLQIDESTFPLDVSALDPVSFVTPSPSGHPAYFYQKDVSFDGRGLGNHASQSIEYNTNPLFDTIGNRDFSICNPPSSPPQNTSWGLDRVYEMGEKNSRSEIVSRIKLEKRVTDTGFQGPLRWQDGGGSKEYMRDYGEAYLASMKEDYVGGLKGTIGNDINGIGDLQDSKVASFVRRDNSLVRFLPSNNEEYAMDVSSCDEFRMYEFKVRRCMKGRSHDWTECPFAHPGEKARRRDPRRFHYSGTACPDFRRGNCKKGDACELSHGVFECWLHPARYRTQLCKDGKSCKRRVCFFAHSPSQLRLVSPEPVHRSGSIFKSPFSNFSDSNHKHPQYALSPSKLALSDCYGAEGFLDDFSPKSMHSFPDDRFLDAFHPISNDCHILDDDHRPSDDGIFESSGPLESIHGNSYNYRPPLDDGNSAASQPSHVHADSLSHNPPKVGIPFDGFCDHLPFRNNQAHVNLRTQLALASLSSKFEQIMSPTSTLVRHVFSPPAQSPPLSPSDSPPMSPSMIFPSCNAMSRKMVSLYGQASSQEPLSAAIDINHSNVNGTSGSNASLLDNLAQSNGTAMFANTCGPSPLSTLTVGDHMNGLATQDAFKEPRLERGIEGEAPSQQTIAHPFSVYQKLKNKRPAHPLNRIPEAKWEADHYWVTPIQRVESGQGLRATIYGNLGKEEVSDAENPDFGWVNDLVT